MRLYKRASTQMLPDIVEAHTQDERRDATGIEGLDVVLGGGLPAEHLYLIEGDPGAGKTTLALQFLLSARDRGEPVLYITLSESIRELQLIAHSHGWSLHGIDLFEVVPPPESLLPEEQYTVFHPGDVELGNTLKSMLDRVEALNPRRVVFDSLSEIRLLARDSPRFRRQILGLKQFLEACRCTGLLLDDRVGGNVIDLSVLSIVHGVIRLERLSHDYGTKRRRLEVVKLRGVKFHDGYHDYDIKTGGLVIYPRLATINHQPAQRQTGSLSGVEQLDHLLGGGLDRGTSTLITGPAGCGKSSIAMQYAAAAARRNEYVEVLLFEEGLTTLLQRSRSLGIDLEKHVNDGYIALRQLDAAELSPGELFRHIQSTVTGRELRVLIIDSLNGLLNSMSGELAMTVQLRQLLSFLNEHGIVTLMVMAQHGIFGAHMDAPVDLSYLADTVILLRFFEAAGKVRKVISVVKKRSGGHEDTLREVRIGPDRITVGEPLKQFQGVLAGVPSYLGRIDDLIEVS